MKNQPKPVSYQAGVFFSAFFLSVYSPNGRAVLSTGAFDQSKIPGSVCAVIFENENGATALCTGDIVARDKILTAAHCVLPPKADETVFVRCQDQNQSKMVRVKGYAAHPLFPVYPVEQESSPYDHALLQVDSDFDLERLGKIRLPKSKGEAMVLAAQGNCAIFGYGVNSKGEAFSLSGGPVKPVINSSLGFPLAVFDGPAMVGTGDSGGGLFCLPHGKTGPDNWIQTAVLSQTFRLTKGAPDMGTAALLSDSVLAWIEKFIDGDLPAAPGYLPEITLQTADIEDMETSERCIARLVGTAARACIAADAVMNSLADEIFYQCGRNESHEFLHSLLEQGRRIADCSIPKQRRRAKGNLIAISRADDGSGLDGGGSGHGAALHEASARCDFDTASLLIEKGADVNALDSAGDVPLHDAALKGCIEIVRLLIENGADVNARNRNGETPLHKAVYADNAAVIRALIDAGADVNSQDFGGRAPLHAAILNSLWLSDTSIISLLIERGADVNSQDEAGNAPFIY